MRPRFRASPGLWPATTRSSPCCASGGRGARSKSSWRMPAKKLVLAYSGGLDTSVAIRWLKDQGWDVIAFTVDLGEKKDLEAIQARALTTGASAAYIADGRLPFLQLFVWPSLQAGGVPTKAQTPLPSGCASDNAPKSRPG